MEPNLNKIKIKAWGFIPITRRNFIIVETIFFVIFTVLAIIFFTIDVPVETEREKLMLKYTKWIFLFSAIAMIIEAQFFLSKFIKAQLRVIHEQKDEIINQRDEIEAQRDTVVKQRDEIEKQKEDITASISYASRIQNAILPPKQYLDKILPEYFILNKPRDIVSGDFYFAEKIKEKVMFTAVDCTGHGVPGAIMSVVGYNYLHQAVCMKGMTIPSEILRYLDYGINESLRQTNNESGVKDGMDIAFCTLDTETGMLEYAGAFNPLYYINNKELHIIKADKLPIGSNVNGNADQYHNHKVQLEKGDTVYVFSDGYADQFGGVDNKKFKYKKLRNLLISIQDFSMNEQKNILDKTIEDWRRYPNKNGEPTTQVDDILIFGVKV